jgi:hypothetical protein
MVLVIPKNHNAHGVKLVLLLKLMLKLMQVHVKLME